MSLAMPTLIVSPSSLAARRALAPSPTPGGHLRAVSGCGLSAGSGCPCVRPCAEVDQNIPLMREGESVRFRRGEVLWRQGEPASSLISVCTGAVKLSRRWPDGREMILDLVFRGQLMGEAAAVPGAVHAATAVALTAGRALRVDEAELRRMLREQPALSPTLLSLAVARQAAFTRRLDELNHGAVESRLARVLLRVGDEVGLKDSRGTFVPVHLSRGDLADLVGCRVETTIRIMTRWQREGVVETQREGLVLRDRAALEAAGQEQGEAAAV
jgi:CRP-like cAMP-binding protein